MTWTLSLNQFNKLKNEKFIYIEFWVEDQPAKSRTKGRLKVEVTQMDLPPDITVVPKEQRYKVKENASVNLKFYLSDPTATTIYRPLIFFPIIRIYRKAP